MIPSSLARVATVGDRAIPLSWVEDRLATLLRGRLGRHLPPGESGETQRLRRWIVQELVARMVLVHEAEQAGLWSWADRGSGRDADRDEPPDVPDEVVGHLFERVTRHVAVSEAEIDDYLARDPMLGREPESRRIRYAIAASEALAWAWIDACLAGSPPGDSMDIRAGQMWLRRGELVGPFEDAIFEADVQQVVGPFQLEQGWAVAQLEAVMLASRLPDRELRAHVEAELRRSAQTRAFSAWIDARRAALARIDDEYEHPGHPIHGIVQHRH